MRLKLPLLRRTAAMTRAVLPNTTAREQWLLAGPADRTTDHWARTPPLDGGEVGDADDTGTDMTVPDDNDDIASSPSQQTATIKPQRGCEYVLSVQTVRDGIQ